MPDQKTCFVISPIGPEGCEVRERADQLLEHIIKDSVENRDYEAVRADDIDEPGQITNQVIQHTVTSELVIADLTGHNPNVFYELAIRHAAREPFIQLIADGEDIPFDIYDQRTITYDLSDLDRVEETKDEIGRQIESLESGEGEVESPISTAMDLHYWEESGDPQQQELAEVIDMIGDLKSEMNQLHSEVNQYTSRGRLSQDDVDRLWDLLDEIDTLRLQIDDLEEIHEEMEVQDEEVRKRSINIVDNISHQCHELKRIVDKLVKRHQEVQ